MNTEIKVRLGDHGTFIWTTVFTWRSPARDQRLEVRRGSNTLGFHYALQGVTLYLIVDAHHSAYGRLKALYLACGNPERPEYEAVVALRRAVQDDVASAAGVEAIVAAAFKSGKQAGIAETQTAIKEALGIAHVYR